jgi:hypothetical protein
MRVGGATVLAIVPMGLITYATRIADLFVAGRFVVPRLALG